MEVLGGQIQKNALKLKYDIALRVIQVVAHETPADTGLARTSWITTVGRPSNRKPKSPAFPGKHLGKGEVLNAQHASGQAQIELWPMTKLKGKIVYIQNNQPYIGELNRGKSRQSGAGFVEKAVLQGIVEAFKAKLVPKRIRV